MPARIADETRYETTHGFLIESKSEGEKGWTPLQLSPLHEGYVRKWMYNIADLVEWETALDGALRDLQILRREFPNVQFRIIDQCVATRDVAYRY